MPEFNVALRAFVKWICNLKFSFVRLETGFMFSRFRA